jgi:formate/nitrite transporter FocA (FNT family)
LERDPVLHQSQVSGRRRRYVEGALVGLAACLFLTTGVLLWIGFAAANDDVGSTWSNSRAHELITPMIVCFASGLICVICAVALRRER